MLTEQDRRYIAWHANMVGTRVLWTLRDKESGRKVYHPGIVVHAWHDAASVLLDDGEYLVCASASHVDTKYGLAGASHPYTFFPASGQWTDEPAAAPDANALVDRLARRPLLKDADLSRVEALFFDMVAEAVVRDEGAKRAAKDGSTFDAYRAMVAIVLGRLLPDSSKLRAALERDPGALEEVMVFLSVRTYSDARFGKSTYRPATDTA